MVRRNNVLTEAELSPQQKPLYIVDDFDSAMHLFLRNGKIRNISPHTTSFYQNQLDIFRRMLEKQRITTVPAEIISDILKENCILIIQTFSREQLQALLRQPDP